MITDQKDEVFSLEKKTFVKMFVYHYLNYDSEIIEKTLLTSMDWVTEEIWNRERPKIKELIGRVKEMGVAQIVPISDIVLSESDSANEYLVRVKVEQLRRGKSAYLTGTIKLKIEPAERVKGSNIWGWQVSTLEESWSEEK